MILKDCKRLAEVDFPIAEVSQHAVREKSIWHGHPSTLHLWWARRPLASSRAVLLALLWPNPCDPLCPKEFKEQVRELLPQIPGCRPGQSDEELRKALLRFIADFANWDLAANRSYLEVSRALVKAAHGEEPPLIVDPFAGGGSIPLEALRLGCEAFASDLNPVACLILKVMLEDIPRHGPKLAEELCRVGAEIKQQAEKELADLYPKDSDGATPIAYLWARTVRCESPNCGAEIPLARSFWLCKKAKRVRVLRHRLVRPAGEPPRVEFRVTRSSSTSCAASHSRSASSFPSGKAGSSRRRRASCACCRSPSARSNSSARTARRPWPCDSSGRRRPGRSFSSSSSPTLSTAVVPAIRGRGRGKRATIEVSDESLQAAREATTLDPRVHAAMLLQAGGRTNALRALLKAEQERGPDFLRLANALSALYPQGSEEKRLLDAMLLAVPR